MVALNGKRMTFEFGGQSYCDYGLDYGEDDDDAAGSGDGDRSSSELKCSQHACFDPYNLHYSDYSPYNVVTF